MTKGKSRMNTNGFIVEDHRQYFLFEYSFGRMVGTKAVTAAEALTHIRACLGLPATEEFELMREAA